MRILLGFLSGLTISAALTYLYGPDWAERLHAVEPGPVLAALEAEAPQEQAGYQHQGAVPQSVAADISPLPAAMPVPKPAEQEQASQDQQAPIAATNETELAWAAFMTRSDQLSTSGDFPWRSCFKRAAATYEVPELLLLAVARGESAFDATARSHRDAIGVMQIRWPQTAAHLGILNERQLYDPCINIDAGARYLRELLGRYKGNAHHALAAYNFGPGRVTAEHVPQLAGKYSSYILRQLDSILDRQLQPAHPSPANRSATTTATASMLLLDFTQSHRARAMLSFLLESAPDLRLSIATSPRGAHGVYLAYADPEEQQQALRAISDTGITIAMAGASRHNQEGIAHDF